MIFYISIHLKITHTSIAMNVLVSLKRIFSSMVIPRGPLEWCRHEGSGVWHFDEAIHLILIIPFVNSQNIEQNIIWEDKSCIRCTPLCVRQALWRTVITCATLCIITEQSMEWNLLLILKCTRYIWGFFSKKAFDETFLCKSIRGRRG